jgi:heat shock protein HslJ
MKSQYSLKIALIHIGVACGLLVAVPTLAANKTHPHGLENRRWHIAKYRPTDSPEGDQQTLIESGKTAEITFANGHINGAPTCGALVGTYKLSGDKLTVQADFILNGFCPPEQLAQNQQVFNALKGDLRVEEESNRIMLRGKNGEARVLLVPY